jgi:hypothetical protein
LVCNKKIDLTEVLVRKVCNFSGPCSILLSVLRLIGALQWSTAVDSERNVLGFCGAS